MSHPGAENVRVPRIRLSPRPPTPEGIVRPERYDQTMGEVRVEVQLTNAWDIALVAHGHILPDQQRSCTVEAVVDTGAVQTVLPEFVVNQLGLSSTERSRATYADGRTEIVPVTDPILIEILGRRTYEEALVLGDEVLIGQTVLEKLDLWVDCNRQRLVPNPQHPDFPVAKIR